MKDILDLGEIVSGPKQGKKYLTELFQSPLNRNWNSIISALGFFVTSSKLIVGILLVVRTLICYVNRSDSLFILAK